MEVKINKNVLLAICAALMLSLLLIAFLLGRESRKDGVVVREQAARATYRPAEGETTAPPPSQPLSTEAFSSGFSPSPPAAQSPAASLYTGGGAEGESVRRYFRQVDGIGSSEEMSGDLNETASMMVQGAFKGDFSSIDGLINKCRRLQEQVRALEVPPPCAEFHRKTLGVLESSMGLYVDLRAIIQGGDLSGLTRLTEMAGQLKNSSRELESMQKEILSRYR
jgi:hypothetical protein